MLCQTTFATGSCCEEAIFSREGYRRLSLMHASAVVKRQVTVVACTLTPMGPDLSRPPPGTAQGGKMHPTWANPGGGRDKSGPYSSGRLIKIDSSSIFTA